MFKPYEPTPTPVKVYRASDVGAPQLKRETGSLKTLLKTCLINGYGEGINRKEPVGGWQMADETANSVIFHSPQPDRIFSQPERGKWRYLYPPNGKWHFIVAKQWRVKPNGGEPFELLCEVRGNHVDVIIAHESTQSATWRKAKYDVQMRYGATVKTLLCGTIQLIGDIAP